MDNLIGINTIKKDFQNYLLKLFQPGRRDSLTHTTDCYARRQAGRESTCSNIRPVASHIREKSSSIMYLHLCFLNPPTSLLGKYYDLAFCARMVPLHSDSSHPATAAILLSSAHFISNLPLTSLTLPSCVRQIVHLPQHKASCFTKYLSRQHIPPKCLT